MQWANSFHQGMYKTAHKFRQVKKKLNKATHCRMMCQDAQKHLSWLHSNKHQLDILHTLDAAYINAQPKLFPITF